MVNSRKLTDLRSDVQANCELFLKECKKQGLNVLVTQTLRDNEYQAQLYAQGRTKSGSIITNSKVTTFHGKGLAFDICKNVKGKEYSDTQFFVECAKIAKEIGFSWGGDWKSFVDMPHFQWDENKKYTGSDIKRGKLPGLMQLYAGGEEEMKQEEFNKMADVYFAQKAEQAESSWSISEGGFAEATKKGILDGKSPRLPVTREQFAAVLKRLGLLK